MALPGSNDVQDNRTTTRDPPGVRAAHPDPARRTTVPLFVIPSQTDRAHRRTQGLQGLPGVRHRPPREPLHRARRAHLVPLYGHRQDLHRSGHYREPCDADGPRCPEGPVADVEEGLPYQVRDRVAARQVLQFRGVLGGNGAQRRGVAREASAGRRRSPQPRAVAVDDVARRPPHPVPRDAVSVSQARAPDRYAHLLERTRPVVPSEHREGRGNDSHRPKRVSSAVLLGEEGTCGVGGVGAVDGEDHLLARIGGNVGDDAERDCRGGGGPTVVRPARGD